jgi:hypothetical protein
MFALFISVVPMLIISWFGDVQPWVAATYASLTTSRWYIRTEG